MSIKQEWGAEPGRGRRLSPLRKAVFGLGDHTVNVALGSLSLVFFTFLVTVAGMQPAQAGLLVGLARVVDAFSDPLMGRISDRTRWRLSNSAVAH